jgi:hypothetical protein
VGEIGQSRKHRRGPVVLSQAQVAGVLSQMQRKAGLLARLPYGTGYKS